MNISNSLFLNSGNKNFNNNELEIKPDFYKLSKKKSKLNNNSYINSKNNTMEENNEILQNNNSINNDNNKNGNNIINNSSSSLKIKIPFEVMDSHPIFLVKRMDEKNKNCKI